MRNVGAFIIILAVAYLLARLTIGWRFNDALLLIIPACVVVYVVLRNTLLAERK